MVTGNKRTSIAVMLGWFVCLSITMVTGNKRTSIAVMLGRFVCLSITMVKSMIYLYMLDL